MDLKVLSTDRKLTTSSILKIIVVMYRNHVKRTNINCGTQQSEFNVLTAVNAGGGHQYFVLLWKTAGHTTLDSKSPWKEIITQYMLIFVTGDCRHSCPLQCSNTTLLNNSISYKICYLQ
jgi:hypothetical protein